MLALYLVCFVLGGLVLLVSIFGAGDGDVDVDAGGDLDLDGTDVGDVDAGDVDAGDVDAGDTEPAGEGPFAIARFLSVRNAVFFTCFFGMTGTLLSLLSARPGPTLAASVVLGLGAALAIHRVMGYLRTSQSGAVPGPAALAGARARVLLGPTRTRPGKVTVSAGDRTHQLVARVHPDAGVDHFERGDTVVVVRVQDGTALVAETTFLA